MLAVTETYSNTGFLFPQNVLFEHDGCHDTSHDPIQLGGLSGGAKKGSCITGPGGLYREMRLGEIPEERLGPCASVIRRVSP